MGSFCTSWQVEDNTVMVLTVMRRSLSFSTKDLRPIDLRPSQSMWCMFSCRCHSSFSPSSDEMARASLMAYLHSQPDIFCSVTFNVTSNTCQTSISGSRLMPMVVPLRVGRSSLGTKYKR